MARHLVGAIKHRAREAARAPRGELCAPPAAGAGERGQVTHQLPLSDVLLPPEVWTHGRDRRQTIVRVHEDVDEAVKCGTEISCRNREDLQRRMY